MRATYNKGLERFGSSFVKIRSWLRGLVRGSPGLVGGWPGRTKGDRSSGRLEVALGPRQTRGWVWLELLQVARAWPALAGASWGRGSAGRMREGATQRWARTGGRNLGAVRVLRAASVAVRAWGSSGELVAAGVGRTELKRNREKKRKQESRGEGERKRRKISGRKKKKRKK